MIVGGDLGLRIGSWSNDALCDVEPICTESEEFVDSGDSFVEIIDILGFENAGGLVNWMLQASAQDRNALAAYINHLMHS